MRTLNFIKYLFFLIGLGMLAGSLYWAFNTKTFLETAHSANGTVTDLIARRNSEGGRTYAPEFSFETAQGRKVTVVSSSSSNPAAYDRGEMVEVLYLPEQPTEAKINGFFSLWGGSLIVGILGLVFTAIGGGMVLWSIMKRRKEEHLKVYGRPIITQFQSVDYNTSLKVNGRSPWVITSQWQDPQSRKIHVFKSDNIWFDPEDYVKEQEITVLVDRENYKRYYMDISFLPELAN